MHRFCLVGAWLWLLGQSPDELTLICKAPPTRGPKSVKKIMYFAIFPCFSIFLKNPSPLQQLFFWVGGCVFFWPQNPYISCARQFFFRALCAGLDFFVLANLSGVAFAICIFLAGRPKTRWHWNSSPCVYSIKAMRHPHSKVYKPSCASKLCLVPWAMQICYCC